MKSRRAANSKSDVIEAFDAEMWRNIKAFLGVQDFAEVSWREVYRAKSELGYPLNRHESEQIG